MYAPKYSRLPFNSAPSNFLHIDINSCFATIEQQANPLLRGKPIIVGSFKSDYGIALAASREAKVMGIKTGTSVKDARKICPGILIVEPDSAKYRHVHLQLRKLLTDYSPEVIPKSIDEFIMDLNQSPVTYPKPYLAALEIKQRIKEEIGEWITVSIGLGPSRFLAKTGAGLHKPDGLDEINKSNFEQIYRNLPVGDLCGIGFRTEPKLKLYGINTAWDLYTTPLTQSNIIFKSIHAYYWHRKLSGWSTQDMPTLRKSIGNSYVMPACAGRPKNVLPILAKLVDKCTHRMRKLGLAAKGIGVMARFEDKSHWFETHKLQQVIFATPDVYKAAEHLLMNVPPGKKIRKIGVTCFNLVPLESLQMELFADTVAKKKLAGAMDKVKKRWGTGALHSARMIATQKYVPDRIAFGNTRELEDLTS